MAWVQTPVAEFFFFCLSFGFFLRGSRHLAPSLGRSAFGIRTLGVAEDGSLPTWRACEDVRSANGCVGTDDEVNFRDSIVVSIPAPSLLTFRIKFAGGLGSNPSRGVFFFLP